MMKLFHIFIYGSIPLYGMQTQIKGLNKVQWKQVAPYLFLLRMM